jgi:hypothetical protein
MALTPWSKIGIIEPSHFDPQGCYIAVDRHRLDDRRPYIYRTHDGGKTWQSIVSGIAAGHFVNAVREDPRRRGLLYAATEEGVDVSFDDGDHWQPLQLNLPVTSVRDLVVHENDLVIATHGRSIWILDNASPLRQIDAKVAAAEAWLFQPPPAFRVRAAGFTGTPMPKDEPMAPNPPAGAAIDYVLARAAKLVTLEIHDAAGQAVNHLSSADTLAKPDPARMRTAPQWIVAPPHLEATPGMHRVVWPFQYAPPAGPPGEGGRGAGGVWAPPGDYNLTLTVDGKTFERTLTLVPDPRVKLEPSAYREQFELAREVEALAARVTKAAAAAAKLRRAAADARAGAEKPVADSLEAFQARLLLLSNEALGSNPANAGVFPPRRIESLRWISGALGNLQRMVDGADAAPSPDARDAFAKLGPMAESALAEWQRFVDRDLDELNQQLRAAGLKPLAVGS